MIGAALTFAGLVMWFVGSSDYSDYSASNSANQYLSSLVAPTRCSMSTSHIGLVMTLVGVAVLVLAIMLRVARGSER